MKKKQIKSPYSIEIEKEKYIETVKPENRMSQEQKDSFNKDAKPVILMEEGVHQPLMISAYQSSPQEGYIYNVMLVLNHHIKEGTLELTGRIRNENNEKEKRVLPPFKRPYSPENVQKLKEKAEEYIRSIEKDGFTTKKLTQLDFIENEPIKEIMKKIEASNAFNISI